MIAHEKQAAGKIEADRPRLPQRKITEDRLEAYPTLLCGVSSDVSFGRSSDV
jgi:hypothetical protein